MAKIYEVTIKTKVDADTADRLRQTEARLEAECGNDEARWTRALRTRSRRWL